MQNQTKGRSEYIYLNHASLCESTKNYWMIWYILNEKREVALFTTLFIQYFASL